MKSSIKRNNLTSLIWNKYSVDETPILESIANTIKIYSYFVSVICIQSYHYPFLYWLYTHHYISYPIAYRETKVNNRDETKVNNRDEF